ncbi:hypothetical protein K466DRAFT_497860 [Polyporus arcularius HHB13444]|uniref:Arrestin-like N-terminal domain-containing protein n=1 Tax=Polyporus arcularius HHB13444 TaxID=1314778 RepID=A0A5C3P273_9APHY|nr:hypothetical protein K466DRAFT_497860 [Polyporus arcularius HHB13444]
MSPPTQSLNLSVPPRIYCAGGDVEGEVLLDFRQLQQENIQQVHVKFRGSVHTYVFPLSNYEDETILVRSSLDLWMPGAAYPPPGTDILRLPFRFRIPENVPPSFHYRSWDKSACVLYELVVVGVRPGTFQFNRRLRIPRAVVPKDAFGARLRQNIGAVGWRKGERTERMRKGLWGEYSTAHVELLYPDIPALPLFTDIPFIINVTTTTAPLTRAQADALPENKPIFPPPPAIHSEINFRLMRITRIRATRFGAENAEDVAYFLGANTIPSKLAVETDLPPKEWVVVQSSGGGEEKGVWVQRARFQTSVTLSVPPTFLCPTIECLYALDLKVPFPGLGNDVRIDIPVTIVSGIDAPSSRISPSMPQVDAPPEPQAYWDANGRDWRNLDEKD